MDKPTVRDLGEWLGISTGLAGNMLAAAWAPDPAKFARRDKYLFRLCQSALRNGHKAPELMRYLADAKRAQAGARATDSKPETEPAEPQPQPAATKQQTPSQATPDNSFQAIESGLRVCHALINGIGGAMVGDLRDRNVEGAALASRDFIKVLAELRQTTTKLEELRIARAELLPRSEVIAAASGLWVELRAFGDCLIGQLTNPGNLPAWVHEAGGNLPDTRETRALMRDRIQRLVEDRFNAMAAALVSSATPGEYSAAVFTECRSAMVEELKRIIQELSK